MTRMKHRAFGRRDPYYAPGDHNVQCDRCDFKRKASECKMTWDNLFVCADTCWEPRQPQDFLRGFPDYQNVDIARPVQTDVFQTTGIETTLGADEAAGQTILTVESTTGLTATENIAVYLDTGTVHTSTIASVTDSTTLTINDALPSKASDGNRVYTY